MRSVSATGSFPHNMQPKQLCTQLQHESRGDPAHAGGGSTISSLDTLQLPEDSFSKDLDLPSLEFLSNVAGLPPALPSPAFKQLAAQDRGLYDGWQAQGAAGLQVSMPLMSAPPLDYTSSTFECHTPLYPPPNSRPGFSLDLGRSPDQVPELGPQDLEQEMEDANDQPVSSLRKAEQNRRAQARFRQRKKDKFNNQQRQIDELTVKLSLAMRERETFQEKATLLQQMMELKDKRIETLKHQNKENVASEELTDAFWEMACELKRGRQGVSYSREDVSGMVNSMLNYRSLELGFIRREVVGQIADCLKSGGEQEGTPSNRWLHDLITAYNRMVRRCGECNPLAFRTFLNLQLPEQIGLSVTTDFWKQAMDAGVLSPAQKHMLAAAHKKLMDKMQQLLSRRVDVRDTATSDTDPTTGGQPPLLGNMEQAKDVLDMHAHILKEEQAAVFNFRTTVGLVLEPVQQAKLMVAAFPFPLDTLAICSVIYSEEARSEQQVNGHVAFLSQLPHDSPFQALAPNRLNTQLGRQRSGKLPQESPFQAPASLNTQLGRQRSAQLPQDTSFGALAPASLDPELGRQRSAQLP